MFRLMLVTLVIEQVYSASVQINPCTIQSTTTTLNPCVIKCQKAPTIGQYDPVCGSDGNTYTNKQKLQCAQKCTTVSEAYSGICVTTSTTECATGSTPTSAQLTTVRNPYGTQDSQCVTACQRKQTSQYNPVCGTDKRTYDNKSKLECANNCRGYSVAVDYNGIC